MKKNNFTGWKSVFSFTLIQTLKNKAYIISFALLLIISIASIPIFQLINSDNSFDENAKSPITKVYIDNQTTLPQPNFEDVLSQEAFQGITFETIPADKDSLTAKVETEETSSVILTIQNSMGYFSLDFLKSSDNTIDSESLSYFGDAMATSFEAYKLELLAIPPETAAMIQANVSTFVTLTDTTGEAIETTDTSISLNEYWFLYGLLFIVLMVNIMASTQIATSIVTEKSTRVVEYLLISVNSLALIIGKVLAMLIAVLLQMVTLVITVFISNKFFSALQNTENTMAKIIPSNIFENLNVLNLLICFILIALGMILYGVLAGLFGATISKIEEMQEGLMIFTLLNLVGAYVGMGAAGVLMGAGMNPFVTFALLFPLSSPFILPGAILIGKASLWMALISFFIQILSIGLLFKFVAKVYESLILHNGETIKLKGLIKMAKTLKGEHTK